MTTILNDGGTATVVTTTSGDLYMDKLVKLADGTYVAVWEGSGVGDDYGIWMRHYDAAGNAVSAPARVNTTTAGYQLFALGSALADGGYVITWQSQSGDATYDIITQRFDAAGHAVGNEIVVNTYTTNNQVFSSVAGLSDGGYVVTWSSFGQDGDRYGVYAQRYDSAGAAVGAEVHVSTYTALSQTTSFVTSLNDGGYVITWSSNGQDGDSYGVYAQRFDAANNPVGSEFHVGSDTVGLQLVWSITTLSDGGYIIAWYGRGAEDDWGAYLQRYDAAGTAVGGQTLINREATGDQALPVVSGLSDGGYVVAWQDSQTDGTNTYSQIQVQRFDASGHRLGEPSYIGYAGGSDLGGLDVTALDDGGFVVGWSVIIGAGILQVYQRTFYAAAAGDDSDHLIYGSGGDDAIAGADGYDQIYGGGGDDSLTAVDSEPTVLDSNGFGQYGDDLYGDDGNDSLTGSVGDNYLDGGAGSDTLAGGLGDDVYFVESVGDVVVELAGQGYDEVESFVTYTLGDNVETLSLQGNGNINGTGNDLDNYLIGNLGNNLLSGGNGNDYFDRGEAPDDGALGIDTLDGGAGNDTYYFSAYFYGVDVSGVFLDMTGANTEAGVTLADGSVLKNIEAVEFYGTSGNDTVTGGVGSDHLSGGGGLDVLNGAGGNDTFSLFDNAVETVDGGDGIDTVILSNYLTPGVFFSAAPAATSAGVTLFTGDFVKNVEQFNISTGYGNDTLNGGAGNDTLSAGGGSNIVNGGGGDDVIFATVFATPFGDTINGGAGRDRLVVDLSGLSTDLTANINASGQYFLETLAQPTRVFTSVELVTLTGGNGNDLINGRSGDDILRGGGGVDTIYGGLGADRLEAGDGGGNLWNGANQIAGLAAEDFAVDTLIGGNGADVIYVGLGDIADGGSQQDGEVDRVFVSFFGRASALNLDLSTGDSYATLASASGGTYANFEEIGTFGTIFADQITGTQGNDRLYDLAPADGAGGDDTYYGLGGDDRISAGSGANYVDGGDGNDILYNTSFEAETFVGGMGDDVIFYGSTAPVDIIGNGSDTIDGGAGSDWLNYVKLSVNLSVDLGLSVQQDTGFNLLTVSGIENVHGGTANDSFRGDGGANWLEGDNGNDTLIGNGGDDQLVGGNGDDRLDGGTGNDSLDGGAGDDILLYNYAVSDTGTDIINGGTGNDTLLASGDLSKVVLSGFEVLIAPTNLAPLTISASQLNAFSLILCDLPLYNIGLRLADSGAIDLSASLSRAASIEASAFGNIITGGVYDDTIGGGAGDDILNGGGSGDSLWGNGGNDQLNGGDGNDILNDYLGNDTFNGGDGNDRLNGGGATIVMNGGQGDDTLSYTNTGLALLDGGDGIDTLLSQSDLTNVTFVNIENFRQDTQLSTIRGTVEQFLAFATLANGYADYRLNLALTNGGIFDLSTRLIGAAEITASDVGNTILTGAGDDLLNGGAGNDDLAGLAGKDILNGGAGEDRLDGGAGNDTLTGGLGNDTYFVDSTGDILIEAETAGTDLVYAKVSFGLDANVENLELVDGAGNINATGNALGNWLVGNEGDNVLSGGDGDDVLIGNGEFASASYVIGGAGADTLQGGNGDDALYGGGSAGHLATLSGGAGADGVVSNAYSQLDGGAGADLLNLDLGDYGAVSAQGVTLDVSGVPGGAVVNLASGGSIRNFETFDITGTNYGDSLVDGNGNGILRGAEGSDRLEGRGGNDWLDGGTGDDTLVGGLGDDTFVVDSAADVVTESNGQGTDTVLSSVSYALGATYIEVLTLTGTANIDAKGNTVNNALNGNAGNNRLDGGVGADTMTGGLGDDTYVVDNAGDVLVELVGQGVDTLQTVFTTTLTAALENLVLTGTTATNGTGNASDNSLTGNFGANSLTGLGGNDRLDGGGGADTLIGGLGNDTYVIDNAGDVVTELNGQGTDTVLSSVSFVLSNALSIETLTLTGPQHINATGNAFANALNGNSGNNTLNGGSGADTLVGGLGHDIYVVENIGDVVIEGVNAGTDTVQSAVSYVLGDNVENLTLAGSGAINGTGNDLANIIYGNAGANVLNGMGGIDKLYGRGGNDTYIIDTAGTGASELLGGTDAGGVDEVRASVSFNLGFYIENLILTGSGNIAGGGNDLANTITGNGGDNILKGRLGNDTLSGGLGADQFVFEVSAGKDRVTDFSAAQNDKINVHALAHGVVGGAGIALSQVGGDTVVDLGGGNMVTIVGALLADVQSHMVW